MSSGLGTGSLDGMPGDNGGISRFIVVRFNDDTIPDLKLNITHVSMDTINTQWLRRLCRELRGEQTHRRRLRFIRNGNILNSRANLGSEILQYFERLQAENTEGTLNELLFYVHCIIGTEDLTDEQLASEDVMDTMGPSADSVTTQAIGFDRLASVGFSEEEIELLRQQFRSTYGDPEEEDDLLNGDESQSNIGRRGGNARRDMRQLEEMWMESGNDPMATAGDGLQPGRDRNGEVEDRFNSIPVTDIRHNKDLLIGITTGFCLGIFALLLMKNEGLFNKRQRMSIIVGVATNVLFCLVRGF